MSADRLRLGVAQITSTDQPNFNLSLIEKLYVEAAGEHADLVVFPENSLYFRIRSGDKVAGLEINGPEVKRLQALVDQHSSPLMVTTAIAEAGAAPLQKGKPRRQLSNSTLFFRPAVAPEKVYSKIHLFDVDVPGAPPVRESDYFANGSEPRMIELNGWKIGLSICYDLRFAELYLKYAQKADLILVPSAFLVPTGEAHWHVLLRARAIEAQAFVAAPAQSGEHRSADQLRKTYGHSLVIDPWGKILAEAEESPQIRVVELDKSAIAKVRAQIPMAGHRRL